MERVIDPFTIAAFAFAAGSGAAARGDTLIAALCLLVSLANVGRFLINLAASLRTQPPENP